MNCIRCPREVIQQRAWAKASRNQRQAWLNSGATVLQGRGMCRACYLRAWRAGEIQHRADASTSKRTPHPCRRCGIDTTRELCRDCIEIESAA